VSGLEGMDLYLGFIKKDIFKKWNSTSKSATSADAADFGIGLLTQINDNI
jgi:hypothetical protein